MPIDSSQERFVDWLLDSLHLEASIFHAGRYCGAWRASTAGRLQSSFHLVLDGQCWLHRPGLAPLALGARDGVLFLRDVPHHLSPSPDPNAHATAMHASMRSWDTPTTDAGQTDVGLACGFFRFHSATAGLLLDSLPDMVILHAHEPCTQGAAQVFDLLRAEAGGDPHQPSPLMNRLAELLLFYVIRHMVGQNARLDGVWALARAPEMTGLLEQLLADPGSDWSIDRMASRVHMSRSNFCRRFTELCSQSPAAFLTALRMQLAAQRLASGESIERAADHVGYRSSAAFSRAFKKNMGEQPGVWRRGSRLQASRPALN